MLVLVNHTYNCLLALNFIILVVVIVFSIYDIEHLHLHFPIGYMCIYTESPIGLAFGGHVVLDNACFIKNIGFPIENAALLHCYIIPIYRKLKGINTINTILSLTFVHYHLLNQLFPLVDRYNVYNSFCYFFTFSFFFFFFFE